jgi:hypothetical protein
MKSAPRLLVCACVSFPLAAQATVDLTTLTPVGVASAAPTPTFVGVPANAPANDLSLLTGATLAEGATFRTVVTGSATAPGFVVNARSSFAPATGLRIAGTTASTGAAGAFGPVDVLATFRAAPGTTGRLQVQLLQFALPINAVNATGVAAGLVDIGADGVPEVTQQTGVAQFPVVFGASGEVRVLVRTEALAVVANGGFAASVLVDTVFLPDPPTSCTITPYGAGCGGAAASGTHVTSGALRAITLLGTGGIAGMPVISAFGDQTNGPALPGGCLLLTTSTVLIPLLADPFGAATHTFTVPVSAAGTLSQQFVPLDLATFTFRASNGLEITCVP